MRESMCKGGIEYAGTYAYAKTYRVCGKRMRIRKSSTHERCERERERARAREREIASERHTHIHTHNLWEERLSKAY